jgi:hypothetical protein
VTPSKISEATQMASRLLAQPNASQITLAP